MSEAAEQTTSKMDPEIKAKWVAALRSGEYLQASSALRVSLPMTEGKFGYCCLGVLADVCGAEWVKRAKEDEEEYDTEFYPQIGGERIDWNEMGTYLSDKFAAKCGIGSYKESITNSQMKLASLNDGNDHETNFESQSFAQIADYIEKNL